MLAKRHKLMADWDRFCREGDVTAIRYADGAAIKDSFGILQRVTFHQQIIARLSGQSAQSIAEPSGNSSMISRARAHARARKAVSVRSR